MGGAAVECAQKFEIYGPETVDRFDYYSNYYMVFALIHFVFVMFIDPMIHWSLIGFDIVTLGFGMVIQVPYDFLAKWGLGFFTLFYTNQVYSAFHPTVAPQILGMDPMMGMNDMMEDMADSMMGMDK